MHNVCVRGIFRSGTNFLKALIELNFNAKVQYDSFGWKHYFFPSFTKSNVDIFSDHIYLYVAKNPYMSLSSLYRYFKANSVNAVQVTTNSLESFIRSPIEICNAQIPGSPSLWFPNPVIMWAQLNHNGWSAAKGLGSRGRFLRYEDLLENPEMLLLEVFSGFPLQRNESEFHIPQMRMKNLNDTASNVGKFFTQKKFDPLFIINKKYINEFSELDIKFIESTIPREIINNLGYEFIN